MAKLLLKGCYMLGKKINNKIIQIREKYEWNTPFQIIKSKETERKDKLYMIGISFLIVPMIIILKLLWMLLYIPAMLFDKLDDILCGY